MSSRPPVEVGDSDVAIVGMAGRFPGAPDVAAFWRNLRSGVEACVRYGDAELREAGVDSDLLADPSYVKSGFPVEGIDLFDAPFFGMSPKDAAIADPQHRIFLEVAWEALENAGLVPESFQGSIGVFAGCGMNAYFTYNILTNPELVRSVGTFLLRHTCNDRDFLPTTVSYKLGLTGPSLAIQTACSTSLVAIHAACQSLLSGECDAALAGGVTILLPHRQGYLYRENEALSPDGRCRAFDHRARGTVVGSGAGALVLRRLEDALRDGDPVHAVIKGSAVNNDGSSKVGYLAPSVEGQARVIAEALAVARVPADSISYVDAHGTGTPVGDPIEVAALTRAYRESSDRVGYCAIGSTKPSIGHLDTAAGVASVIKVVEALKHAEIPPSIHFEAPNPEIDFASTPFFVNDRLREWSVRGIPRRAGVSSLGIGGTNAHVILEEAPAREPSETPGRCEQVLVQSARTPTALAELGRELARHLADDPRICLADLAHTLQAGRKPLEERRIAVCADAAEAASVLEAGDPSRVFSGRAERTQSVAFLFSGAASQYPQMGRGLYEAEPVYREAIDHCAALFAKRTDFDVRELMYPEAGREQEASAAMRTPSGTIAAVFSVEIALARLWRSWGIEPRAMIGHSLGEYVAAHLAGVFSLEDAIEIVALRGRLIGECQGVSGAMLSVPLPPEELRSRLGEHLDLAAVNAPSLCVVSGPVDAIAALEAELAREGIETRRLRVVAAGHGRMMDPILGEFRRGIAAVELAPPRIPYVSNVTGTWVRSEEARDPGHWVRHLRQTVLFSDGLSELLRDGSHALLEVGPGQTLCSLARQQTGRKSAVLSSLRHPDDETPDLRFALQSLGRLWCAGVEVDWSRLHAGERRLRVAAPTYPFERERYWIEPGRAAAEPPRAEIRKLADPDEWFYRPVWRRAGRAGPAGPREALGWLLFVDRAGLGDALASRLRSAGHRVATVRERDAFFRLDDESYALAPESGREGYEQLIRDLRERGRMPDRIVHLWSVTADETVRPGSSFFHHSQERGFYSLLFLAQALAGEELGGPLHVAAVSNGMQRVGEEELPHPEKATLLGPVKVIPREMPGISCQAIDVDLPVRARRRSERRRLAAGIERIAGRLVAELVDPEPGAVLAYRGPERFAEGFERIPAGGLPGRPTLLREGGVYLVTGGLGGIGLAVAEHLARECRAKLVLVGRRGLPERHRWSRWLESHAESDPTSRRIRKVLELEGLGSEVVVAAADLANLERMRELLADARERFGPLNGVLHVAGAVEDDPIALKTQSGVEAVFTPKVHGTRALDRLLREETPDFVVLFSSTSAILGPAGQVDYVAANAFENAYAHSRAARGGPRVVAIDWGVWKGTGMGTQLSARLRGEQVLEGELHELSQHPLLGERIRMDVERTVHRAVYSAEDQWILDEHRTGSGRALVPGTGILEMARAAARELLAGDALELRDVTFVSPLAVPDGTRREVRIELRRDGDGFDFELTSESGAGGQELHARGHAARLRGAAPEPLPLDEIEARCTRRVAEAGGGPLQTAQARRLRFGPRWQCLRDQRLSRDEALAHLELAAEFAGDLPTYALHPALLDLAAHHGLPLIEGYAGSDAVYVPFSVRRVRVHAPLAPRVVSWVRSRAGNASERQVAAFDVAVADEQGRVLVELEELTVRRLAGSDALLAPRSEGAREGGASRQVTDSERLFLRSYESGIEAGEGMAALSRVLASDAPPQLVVSSIDLPTWLARTDATLARAGAEGERFARPSLRNAYEAPRDELERKLAEAWQELLGIEEVGIGDDFFELGGHSLIAVRLFARIKHAFGFDEPISVLFQTPTIEKLAALVRERVGDAAAGGRTVSEAPFKHLVQMTPGDGSRPPFFVVAGMFGNVLNLRHLAVHVGSDQAIYALQARGLYGEDPPHRRFEEAARDYLRELRSVQPEGPYYVGGFSGGGVTAFEMAHQLLEQGEEVGLLVGLDSMPPRDHTLTRRDRLDMLLYDLRRHGPGALLEWARNRVRWELERRERRSRGEPGALTPAEFRSEQIEIAFREALDHYRLRVYPEKMLLFRPPPDRRWVLRDGRIVNSSRCFVDHTNHWKPWVAGGIDVIVVSGDHDGMVLEPHVRVLAAKLRECLDEAQRRKREVQDGGG